MSIEKSLAVAWTLGLMLWSEGMGGKRVQVRIDRAGLFQEALSAKYSLRFKLDVTIYLHCISYVRYRFLCYSKKAGYAMVIWANSSPYPHHTFLSIQKKNFPNIHSQRRAKNRTK